MTTLSLYYATNRNHEGDNRWKPDGYGKKFSDDGMENLRFGCLTVDADDAAIARYAGKNMKEMGIGDGGSLGLPCKMCCNGKNSSLSGKIESCPYRHSTEKCRARIFGDVC